MKGNRRMFGNETKKPSKKNPLKAAPLPQAGDSVNLQREHVLDSSFSYIILTGLFAAVTITQWITWSTGRQLHPAIFTVLTIVVAVLAFFKFRSAIREARQLSLGRHGEIVVGRQLEQLRTRDYRVYHDIPGEGFNIDHVLIGPAGVIVIETKTIRKRARGNPTIFYDGKRILVDGQCPDRDPIAQVRASRDSVVNVLAARTGQRPKNRPVVLYPGWWIDPQPKGVEVWVLTPEALPAFLDNEPAALAPDQIARFGSALEDHIGSKRAD